MTGIVKYERSGELDVMTLGSVLAQSGYFQDARDAAQAVVKVLAGRELGIGSIAAMTGIFIVKGRVTLSANLMAAQIKRSGKYNYRVARLDDTGCELIFFEGSQEIGRSSFTDADAKAAGLLNSSDPWRKTPRNMYFARAISNGAKWYTPDVFSGPVYTPDELSDASPIDVTPAAPSVPAVQRPPRPAADLETGEVVEAPRSEPKDGTISGVVQGEPKSKFAANGLLHLNFKVAGKNFLVKGAAPELAYIEPGDVVTIASHPEQIAGKMYNVVDSLTGQKDADGMTSWEERAVSAAADDAEFEPVEAGATVKPMLEADLPASL